MSTRGRIQTRSRTRNMSQPGTTANSTTTAPIAAAAPLPQDSKQGRLCEIFTGSNPLIHVDDWIGLFTLVTKGFTDEQRIVALGRHVGGEAMRWLIRDIVPVHDQVTWQQVSTRMVTRFQRATHSFFNDAMDRELKANETIEEFFNDKRRLMALANIGEPNQVAAHSRNPTHIDEDTDCRSHACRHRCLASCRFGHRGQCQETVNT